MDIHVKGVCLWISRTRFTCCCCCSGQETIKGSVKTRVFAEALLCSCRKSKSLLSVSISFILPMSNIFDLFLQFKHQQTRFIRHSTWSSTLRISIKLDFLSSFLVNSLLRECLPAAWCVMSAVCICQGLKKPYNPILGETFRCCWLHPQTNSCTFYIAEQVKHSTGLFAWTYFNISADGAHMQEVLNDPFVPLSLHLSSVRCPTIRPYRPFTSATGRTGFLSAGASWPSLSSMVNHMLQYNSLSVCHSYMGFM